MKAKPQSVNHPCANLPWSFKIPSKCCLLSFPFADHFVTGLDARSLLAPAELNYLQSPLSPLSLSSFSFFSGCVFIKETEFGGSKIGFLFSVQRLERGADVLKASCPWLQARTDFTEKDRGSRGIVVFYILTRGNGWLFFMQFMPCLPHVFRCSTEASWTNMPWKADITTMRWWWNWEWPFVPISSSVNLNYHFLVVKSSCSYQVNTAIR